MQRPSSARAHLDRLRADRLRRTQLADEALAQAELLNQHLDREGLLSRDTEKDAFAQRVIRCAVVPRSLIRRVRSCARSLQHCSLSLDRLGAAPPCRRILLCPSLLLSEWLTVGSPRTGMVAALTSCAFPVACLPRWRAAACFTAFLSYTVVLGPQAQWR